MTDGVGGGPTLEGRVIVRGQAEGPVLFRRRPVSFLGDVDAETGKMQADVEGEGDSVEGAVLVFPTGVGSTVGSYVLYRLHRTGSAPAAIVNDRTDPVTAAGAVMAQVPVVDGIDIGVLADAGSVRVDGATVQVV